MPVNGLASIAQGAWLYLAAPLLALAAIVLSWRLRGVQLGRLGQAFRNLRDDPTAEGHLAPGLASALASAGAFGAAAAAGSATAIALGGAGAIAWLWLFGLLLAPLRYAETLLCRTDAPGRAEGHASGSLAHRLMRDRSGAARSIGMALAVLVPLTAFAFVGGVHGGALRDAAAQLLPDSATWLVGGAAAAAAVLALAGPRRSAPIAGWVGLVGFFVVLATAGWAAASEPGRVASALGRAFAEAFDGAPPAEPFVGAFAGEIAFVAVVQVLPPFAATTGVSGVVQSLARPRSTRGQAAASLLDPLLFAAVATVLMVAFVATGAHYQRVDDRVPLTEVRFLKVGFETASQRAEMDRRRDGYVRIRDGEMQDIGIEVATHQGVIKKPRFEYDGEPADVALHLEDGKPFRMLRPREHGALDDVPLREVRHLQVQGKMLPRAGGLWNVAMVRGTGDDLAARLGLAGLLALLAVAAAVWGLAVARSVPAPLPHPARVALSLLPAAGLALVAAGALPWLPPLGRLLGALLASAAAVGLLLRSGEAARLGR